jgi:hypothetical protein
MDNLGAIVRPILAIALVASVGRLHSIDVVGWAGPQPVSSVRCAHPRLEENSACIAAHAAGRGVGCSLLGLLSAARRQRESGRPRLASWKNTPVPGAAGQKPGRSRSVSRGRSPAKLDRVVRFAPNNQSVLVADESARSSTAPTFGVREQMRGTAPDARCLLLRAGLAAGRVTAVGFTRSCGARARTGSGDESRSRPGDPTAGVRRLSIIAILIGIPSQRHRHRRG